MIYDLASGGAVRNSKGKHIGGLLYLNPRKTILQEKPHSRSKIQLAHDRNILQLPGLHFKRCPKYSNLPAEKTPKHKICWVVLSSR